MQERDIVSSKRISIGTKIEEANKKLKATDDRIADMYMDL